MLTELLSVGDTIIRVPFWFLFELIISSRIDGLSKFIMRQPKFVASVCPDCPGVIEERHIPIFITYIAILCLTAMLFHPMAVFAVHALLLGTTIAWTCLMSYVLLLRFAYAPWEQIDMDSITEIYLGSSFSLSLIILCLMSILAYPNQVTNKRWFLVSSLAAAVPVVCYLPAPYLIKTGPLNYDCHLSRTNGSSAGCSSPAWYAYGVVSLRARHCHSSELPYDLCALIDPSYRLLFSGSVCPAVSALRCSNYFCDPRVREFVYTLARFSVPVLNVLLLSLCVKLTQVVSRLRSTITDQLELYRMVGIFEFISHHWNRLNIPRTLAFLWVFKVFAVILYGPKQWPIFPTGYKEMDAHFSNLSLLLRYGALEEQNQTTISILFTRASVGALVHGSESWLIVFGAASFFGAMAILVVNTLVRLLDPRGKHLERLFVTAREAPVDLLEWSVIEDPALAMDQNDLLAVEMLSGTGWNSAVVFLFLAFQYDLPSLPVSQRVSCCLYGITVIAITCVHPVQALIKSLLLRLDAPGRRDSSTWFDHLRPLVFCFGLIGASFCIINYAPEQLVAANATSASTASSTSSGPLLPRFGSSVESLKARQMRIVLCGCQLLLGLIVTLIEYVIYQVSHRIPDWSGFRPALFWTKLVSSVLDYMISLLSFLTVCWLSVYDSIGVCRMFIICCYFYFILYPSAVRAYTWVRWKLLFRQRIHSLSSPSESELVNRGSTCPICYVDMTPDSSRMTRCGHLYHIECLSRWMRRQLFCPICHADLLSTKVTDRRRVTGNQGNIQPIQA
ncbi:hypothetical protein CRM22_006140 [Opisthorchis felineus]|uniref:RING-type domain-containing protein n=1 Tax=Opisthorchis felineus TaxID=147828 RepID=A0A4S2LMD1_OPIFE|nr:hypothetical protein CRM22_006140 [Opisthorchis felineus]